MVIIMNTAGCMVLNFLNGIDKIVHQGNQTVDAYSNLGLTKAL